MRRSTIDSVPKGFGAVETACIDGTVQVDFTSVGAVSGLSTRAIASEVLAVRLAEGEAIEEASKEDDDYFRWNMRLLRNTGLGNILDGCGVTLPCQAQGDAPVGLSVAGFAGQDRRVLAVARAIEGALAQVTGRAAG